jgi:hypothetical protein
MIATCATIQNSKKHTGSQIADRLGFQVVGSAESAFVSLYLCCQHSRVDSLWDKPLAKTSLFDKVP